jgi:crotonobetainyl-CoA:carnitine CoA-transferase CaiB-like acyl-CoA transferase
VLDLSSHLAGPFCTMQLADLGAEVIKIESPRGDLSRSRMSSLIKGQAPYFLAVNRNKKGIVLNLKTREALEIFFELVKISDIVVENYRPGVVKNLSVDYETVSKVNPKIVYASISGFGQTGPYRNRPSFDLMAQSMSGMINLSNPEKEPIWTAGSIGDTIPALYTTVAILSALHYARTTGKGQYIDVSQVHSLTASMPIPVQTYLITGLEDDDTPRGFPKINLKAIYKTVDGYVSVSALYHFLGTFLAIVGKDFPNVLESWTENKSLTKETHNMVIEWFKNKTNNEVDYLLSQGNIPFSIVYSLPKLEEDPHAKERSMFVEYEHPLGFKYKIITSPMKMTETNPTMVRNPPLLGENTEEVLSNLLGYDHKKINELREKNAIK